MVISDHTRLSHLFLLTHTATEGMPDNQQQRFSSSDPSGKYKRADKHGLNQLGQLDVKMSAHHQLGLRE